MIKMKSPGEFDFWDSVQDFIYDRNEKREALWSEGFSLKRLKLFMNALLSMWLFIGSWFWHYNEIDSESDYLFGNCLFL